MSTTDFSDDAEQRARDVFDADDARLRKKHDLSPAELLQQRYRLDASEFSDSYALREAKHEAEERRLSDLDGTDTGETVTDFSSRRIHKQARDAMIAEDLQAVTESDMHAAKWLNDHYEIDVRDYDDTAELRSDLNAARSESKRNGWR